MQKIRPALERFNEAVIRLEQHLSAQAAAADKSAEAEALELQCAHLRAEVSALKKQKAELEAVQKRAAAQIDKAMARIDGVLEES